MEFRTQIASGKEVLFVGHERGNFQSPADWLKTGRWKIGMRALDDYLTKSLTERSYGVSISRFVFCFEIADFELWGASFLDTADFTSYRPKSRALWSVGQLRWSDVKDYPAAHQLGALRVTIQSAIHKVSTMSRKPRDFACEAFASDVDAILAQAPVEALIAKPAA